MKKHFSSSITMFLVTIVLLLCLSCNQGNSATLPSEETASQLTPEERKAREKVILQEFYYDCALGYPLYSQERQKCLDEGLKAAPDFAYLWQQKAMPLFKQGKYEVGMEYLNQAVKYKPEQYLPYRAFMKCIFSKTYADAIEDFERCLQRYGNNYVMDHTYKFYIGLSLLQLNKFEEAEAIFQEDIAEQTAKWGEAHHLDLFYFGISKYEQGKLREAIAEFDKALELYPDFAEVQYFKYVCLKNLGKTEEAVALLKTAEQNGLAGNTINEDNVIYERYPYQVRW